jgi:aryl-alcohol dehydrogenase-like predicted oxidoreductase
MDRLPTAEEMGIVSLQPPYNVVWRHLDTDGLNFCREHDIAVTPYSPLAQGLLTGRFTRKDREPHAEVRENNLIFQEPHFQKCKEAAAVVDEVADEGGYTSAQVALAWLLHTPGVTAPIVGASSWDQMEDNLQAAEIELTKEQYERISAAGLAAWHSLPDDAAMWGWKLTNPNPDA